MAATSFQSPHVRWNLSDFFAGIDDERIQQAQHLQAQRTSRFAEKYRGRINASTLTAALLAEALRDAEIIAQENWKLLKYAQLQFATNSGDAAIEAFLQRMQQASAATNVAMLFFNVELCQADEACIAALMNDPVLSNYRHYIARTRAFRDHQLGEAVERVCEELSVTGGRAWQRLYESTMASISYAFAHADGTTEVLTQAQLSAKFSLGDRAARHRAAAAFATGLSKHARVITFAFNSLLQDKATSDRLRHYTFPEQQRHIDNELDHGTVEVVLQTVEKNGTVVARFYELKREILGLPELADYDRYAPLFTSVEQVGFDAARALVLEAFGSFAPEFRCCAEEFFSRGWIDAEVRRGKNAGAFCSGVTPDLHPYVLINYQNRTLDVLTLAHELGHGVHFAQARGQTYFNFVPTIPMAEVASIFAEMLVFEKLTAQGSPQERLACYADKIQGACARVFQAAALHRFEQDCHNHRRTVGELSTDQIGAYWLARQQSIYGRSLTISADFRMMWAVLPHFTSWPFYIYGYAFGELLALALYRRYKKEGSGFVAEYLALLRKGGLESPAESMRALGIDIRDPNFWQGGLDAVAQIVDEFAALWQQQRQLSN